FARYRDRASELANHYAGLYRGAFALNYVLGALALLFAAFGTLFPTSAWAILWPVCIVAIFVNTAYARPPEASWFSWRTYFQAHGSRRAPVLNYVLIFLAILFSVLGFFISVSAWLALVLTLLELA